MCKKRSNPILIPSETPLPHAIEYMPAYTKFGKYPTLIVRIKNDDGSTRVSANIEVVELRDTNNYITQLLVNDAPGGDGKTSDNLIITIKK